MKEIQNYINGKFQSPVNGRTIDDINDALYHPAELRKRLNY